VRVSLPQGVAVVGALCSASLVSCASTVGELELKRLSTAVEAMRADLSRQQGQVEELSNRLFVLSDRLETPTSTVDPGPLTPGLKVVRLVPEVVTEEESGDDGSTTPLATGLDDGGPSVVITLAADGEPQPLSVVSVPPPPRLGDSGDADKLFGAALSAYREGQVEDAYRRFAVFLKKFPTHAIAANAVYWMGECRFDAREYRQAVAQYARVVKKYPGSNKIPDSLFKIGVAYERLGEMAKAQQVFEAILTTYPKSALAELARHHAATLAGTAKGLVPQEGSSR
jgi:tol-pal system protein YbgF